MSIDYTEPITETESLVRPERSWEDGQEYSLRPTRLSEYIGQAKAKGNLEIFIQAAKLRQEPLDHVLLYGPPGLGKTTLSRIIANEMNVNIRTTSGPAIEKPGDLAALLMGSCGLTALLRLGAASADDAEKAQQLAQLLYCVQKPWLNADY